MSHLAGIIDCSIPGFLQAWLRPTYLVFYPESVSLGERDTTLEPVSGDEMRSPRYVTFSFLSPFSPYLHPFIPLSLVPLPILPPFLPTFLLPSLPLPSPLPISLPP